MSKGRKVGDWEVEWEKLRNMNGRMEKKEDRLKAATSQCYSVSVCLCHHDRSATVGNPEQLGPRCCTHTGASHADRQSQGLSCPQHITVCTECTQKIFWYRISVHVTAWKNLEMKTCTCFEKSGANLIFFFTSPDFWVGHQSSVHLWLTDSSFLKQECTRGVQWSQSWKVQQIVLLQFVVRGGARTPLLLLCLWKCVLGQNNKFKGFIHFLKPANVIVTE